MTDNLVKINLGFENVCGIDIPAKYIRNLRIADVTQHSSYDLNTNNGPIITYMPIQQHLLLIMVN